MSMLLPGWRLMWQPYAMPLAPDRHTNRVKQGSHSQYQQVMKISQNEYLTKPCFRKIHKSFKFTLNFKIHYRHRPYQWQLSPAPCSGTLKWSYVLVHLLLNSLISSSPYHPSEAKAPFQPWKTILSVDITDVPYVRHMASHRDTCRWRSRNFAC